MKPKAITAIIQILVWIGLLLLPLLFTPPHPRGFPDRMVFNPMVSILTSILPIGFYYLNYYKLIPLLYLRKRTFIYILSVIGSLGIVILFSFICYHLFNHQPNDTRPMPPLFGHSTLLFIVVLFVSLGLRMNFEYKKAQEEKAEIEKQKLNTELSYLKAQVNPHFLFNTLNIIYTLATIKSEQTADAVMKLSKLMRYVILDAHTPFVPLEKELGYVENFIELHRLRLSNNNLIDLQILGNPEGLQIAPFILIPFVENAIKHGTSAIDLMIIRIDISILKNQLQFSVINNKLSAGSEILDSTGVGIENTRKRLDMIYKKNHSLKIRQTDKTFEVNLKMELI